MIHDRRIPKDGLLHHYEAISVRYGKINSMQKFTQKYTIICLLEDKEEGYEYPSNSWPLHTTLADTFAIEKDINALKTLLDDLVTKVKRTSVEATHNEYFGPNQDIKVTVLDKNNVIKDLHYEIMDSLESLGVKFNDPQYTKDGFKPHATAQEHSEVKVGESININNLAIVDMFPNHDAYQRKILKKVNLN